MRPMRRLNMHSRGLSFFPFGLKGAGGGGALEGLLFPSSFECVLQDVPNSPTLWPKLNCHIHTRVSILGIAQCFKIIDDGPFKVHSIYLFIYWLWLPRREGYCV